MRFFSLTIKHQRFKYNKMIPTLLWLHFLFATIDDSRIAFGSAYTRKQVRFLGDGTYNLNSMV